MSRTKNKAKASRRKVGGAAHRGSPSRHRPKFKIGERVRIVDICEYFKDTNYDRNLKQAELREMRTAELFRFCIGRIFTVYGFDRYRNVELNVSNSSAVRKKFGKWHTIWIEPEFVERVGGQKSKRAIKLARIARGLLTG